LIVRVPALTSGKIVSTLPGSAGFGSAVVLAMTAWPGRRAAAWLSGTSASTHTVARLAMKSVMPGNGHAVPSADLSDNAVDRAIDREPRLELAACLH
jgi:hypothetical protein